MEEDLYSLTEVAAEELPAFKEELGKYLPSSLLIHGAIDMELRHGILTATKSKLYRAISNSFSSFAVLTPVATDSLGIFWSAKEIQDCDAEKLVFNLPDFKWDLPFALFVPSYEIKLKVDVFIKKRILKNETKLEQVLDQGSERANVLSISREELRLPKIADTYELKRLPPSCASFLLSKWDIKLSESVEGLSQRLSILEGIGIFRTKNHPLYDAANNDKAENNLVAWTHQYVNGVIGMTFTIPEERKKGLGVAVILALAKKILDQDRIPYVMITVGNQYSLKLHENIGFKVIGQSGMSFYLPLGQSLESFNSTIS